MALTYFAQDGSYGDASGLVIIDTRAWPQDDWDRVDTAHDRDRVRIALEVGMENGDI